jgi:hypothetical protein
VFLALLFLLCPVPAFCGQDVTDTTLKVAEDKLLKLGYMCKSDGTNGPTMMFLESTPMGIVIHLVFIADSMATVERLVAKYEEWNRKAIKEKVVLEKEIGQFTAIGVWNGLGQTVHTVMLTKFRFTSTSATKHPLVLEPALLSSDDPPSSFTLQPAQLKAVKQWMEKTKTHEADCAKLRETENGFE